MSSRNRQAALAQRLHGADDRHVVDGEDRGRQRVERQHLLRGAIAADLIDGGAEDEFLAIGNAGGRERLAIAAQPLAAGRRVVGVGQMGDVAMADRDQVLDQPACA